MKKPTPSENVATARAAAARTETGREIVIDWPDGVDYFDAASAKQAVVDGGQAKWRVVSNGYGGFDYALIKTD